MRSRPLALVTAAVTASSALLALGLAAPASARVADGAASPAGCVVPGSAAAAADAAARGGDGHDTRDISAAEQARIEKEVKGRLAERDISNQQAKATAAAATVPVYVHVMRSTSGAGDVTDAQVTQQVAVMNNSFAGGKSPDAANLGFTFTLAGIDRYSNDQWHTDKQSSTYRKQTRQGGRNALNIWLVDFDYLGIATFPWDYAKNPGIDGIRVQYSSLPGGSATNYNLGETATHEAGHWFGLYHTFQGGCTATNDEVSDTPAQASSTSGCPEGRDSCTLPGLDPIHNFMDYSYDSCYTMFTAGQSSRAAQMWAAYRA